MCLTVWIVYSASSDGGVCLYLPTKDGRMGRSLKRSYSDGLPGPDWLLTACATDRWGRAGRAGIHESVSVSSVSKNTYICVCLSVGGKRIYFRESLSAADIETGLGYIYILREAFIEYVNR